MFSFSRFMYTRMKQFRLNSFPKSSILYFTRIGLSNRYYTHLTRGKVLESLKMPTHSRCMGMVNVQHDDKRFYIKMDNEIAYLLYNIDNGIMYVTHTKVPEKLNGHGLGKLLSKAALEYAIQHDLLVKISCPFVTRYVKKYEPHFLKYIL